MIEANKGSKTSSKTVRGSRVLKGQVLGMGEEIKRRVVDVAAVDQYLEQDKSIEELVLVQPSIELAPILFLAAVRFVADISSKMDQEENNGENRLKLQEKVQERDRVKLKVKGKPMSKYGVFLQQFYQQVLIPEAERQTMQRFYRELGRDDAFVTASYKEIGSVVFSGGMNVVPIVGEYEEMMQKLAVNSVMVVGSDIGVDEALRWSVLVDTSKHYYERCLLKFQDVVSVSSANTTSSTLSEMGIGGGNGGGGLDLSEDYSGNSNSSGKGGEDVGEDKKYTSAIWALSNGLGYNVIFGGLSAIMAHFLIYNSRHLKKYSADGNKKMQRNILALQQNLTSIGLLDSADGLDRAMTFYILYDRGIDGIISHINQNGLIFGRDDYRRLVDLYVRNNSANKASLDLLNSLLTK
ncbi:Exocyst complex component 4 [Zancudomyces culisetae]|uniref:Exocyst complex component Sec8 n=1 Tax=Zancudomyces culisetae TaxID=1213189 RepID=A0A1R1PUX6_ZANCU|nr:Exocyst complex component 4 [Zancudomyces culisetae]|eukprot:OMH84785.1 Exocyst complex component 4 [Zancudomyces culisetae]